MAIAAPKIRAIEMMLRMPEKRIKGLSFLNNGRAAPMPSMMEDMLKKIKDTSAAALGSSLTSEV
jgi:hypothetical protein